MWVTHSVRCPQWIEWQVPCISFLKWPLSRMTGSSQSQQSKYSSTRSQCHEIQVCPSLRVWLNVKIKLIVLRETFFEGWDITCQEKICVHKCVGKDSLNKIKVVFMSNFSELYMNLQEDNNIIYSNHPSYESCFFSESITGVVSCITHFWKLTYIDRQTQQTLREDFFKETNVSCI